MIRIFAPPLPKKWNLNIRMGHKQFLYHQGTLLVLLVADWVSYWFCREPSINNEVSVSVLRIDNCSIVLPISTICAFFVHFHHQGYWQLHWNLCRKLNSTHIKPQETMFNVDVTWFCQTVNIAYMVLPSSLYASVGIGNIPRSPVQEMQWLQRTVQVILFVLLHVATIWYEKMYTFSIALLEPCWTSGR